MFAWNRLPACGNFRKGGPNTGGALREGLSQHYEAENQCEPVPTLAVRYGTGYPNTTRRKISASPSLTHPTPFLSSDRFFRSQIDVDINHTVV
ncbi:hypothetical protein [Moorena sp. SIO4E2]|nr:hypothetical protein [Moorena sp. SIO4E2]